MLNSRMFDVFRSTFQKRSTAAGKTGRSGGNARSRAVGGNRCGPGRATTRAQRTGVKIAMAPALNVSHVPAIRNSTQPVSSLFMLPKMPIHRMALQRYIS